MTDEQGKNITVAMVLAFIDSFLTVITATFDVSCEPYSSAIKVVKCAECVFQNQPVNYPTQKDIELFIDVLEKASVARYPEAQQEFAPKALVCKAILKIFTENNII